MSIFSRRSRACVVVAIAFSAAFTLSVLSARSAAQTGSIETLGPPADPAIGPAFIHALASTGYRILPGPGSPALELWFCKEVPAQTKPVNSDAVYDRFSETTLIGILRFAKNSNDYRGQSVSAGFYSLRYALMPNDGNHLGVAPGRDFLLLVPIGVDPGPQKTLTTQELMALSRQAAGTRHPAPMSLVPAQSEASKPTLTRDGEGDVIFTGAVRLAGGEGLPIALVVKGTAPQ